MERRKEGTYLMKYEVILLSQQSCQSLFTTELVY